jgi:hypothetical protein
MRLRIVTALALVLITVSMYAKAPDRDTTRDRLRKVLDSAGQRSDVDIEFHQSTKQPYNFVGSATEGLLNAESLEVVIRVTESDTIAVRIYPHYQDGYINVGKLKDARGLMRKLLQYNDSNFLFWGADDSEDIFAAYSFTLESGFPAEAVEIVLRSIRSTDKYTGELRPFIDGSVGVTK